MEGWGFGALETTDRSKTPPLPPPPLTHTPFNPHRYRCNQLRNPWGEQEWNGDWSDDSPLWTRRMKAKLNVTSDNDGEFWMSLDDFSRHFKNIYVCRLFDDGIWNETHIDSEWCVVISCVCLCCSDMRPVVEKGKEAVRGVGRG